MTDTEARSSAVSEVGNFKNIFKTWESKEMNKNYLESDTKDDAISQENIDLP